MHTHANNNRNADNCNKALETTKRSPSKLENSLAMMRAELKAINKKLIL